MTNLNKVILIGNLTRNVEEKDFGYLANGTAKMNLSIAVNRSIKKDNQWQNETSFFEILVWGKLAENLKPYMYKGLKIAVCGFLKQDRWESKDGKKNSKVYIVADEINLLDKKESSLQQQSEEQTTSNFQEDIPF